MKKLFVLFLLFSQTSSFAGIPPWLSLSETEKHITQKQKSKIIEFFQLEENPHYSKEIDVKEWIMDLYWTERGYYGYFLKKEESTSPMIEEQTFDISDRKESSHLIPWHNCKAGKKPYQNFYIYCDVAGIPSLEGTYPVSIRVYSTEEFLKVFGPYIIE